MIKNIWSNYYRNNKLQKKKESSFLPYKIISMLFLFSFVVPPSLKCLPKDVFSSLPQVPLRCLPKFSFHFHKCYFSLHPLLRYRNIAQSFSASSFPKDHLPWSILLSKCKLACKWKQVYYMGTNKSVIDERT